MRKKSFDELCEGVAWELAERVANDAATSLERELPGFRATGDQLHLLAEKICDCISVEIKILKAKRRY